MKDTELLRQMLASLLLESSVRFTALAQLHAGQLIGPVFSALASERVELVEVFQSHYPDQPFFAAVKAEALSPDLEVMLENVNSTAGQEDFTALEVAIAAETDLSETLEDLPEDVLAEQIRSVVSRQIDGGLVRLRRAREDARNAGLTIEFTVKSIGGRLEPHRVPTYEVWYGTNRAPVHRQGELIGFSAESAAQVTYGKCAVSIPKTHRIGESKPSLMRWLRFGDRPLSLASVSSMSGPDFWTDIAAELKSGSTPGDAIVFLHGYRVSFEDAAICAAQMGADLGVQGGAMAFFSWPSQGRLFGYSADEAAIEASEVTITDFLGQFIRHSSARKVHLVAHSMGNRGLLRAVNRIAAQAAAGSGKTFGQIILAAPDVDRRTFEMLYGAYEAVADRTTLYLSQKDLAIRSSRFLHIGDRVGLAPPVTVLPNIDTVNVSKVDLSLLGHGYVSSCRPVLTDMHQMLVSDIAPDLRAGLSAVTVANGRYWELAA